MKKIFLTLLIVFLFILNVGPLLLREIGPNVSYNYDFYAHATGANQVIEESSISFERDDRMFWGENTELFYPPGFMMFLAVVSLVTGISVLYLPLITIIQWIIYIILVYIIAKEFFKEKKYVYLSVIFALMFITGTRFLGFSYLVPPILGVLLLWSILFVAYNDRISEIKKIIVNSMLISAILLSHRPSTLAFILALISITVTTIIINIKSLKKIANIWLSFVLALNISTVIFYIKVLNSTVAIKYFYNMNYIPIDFIVKWIYLIMFVLTILAIGAYYILSKYDTHDIGKEIVPINNKILLATVLIFVGAIIIGTLPFIKDILVNFRSILSHPFFFIFNIWELLVDKYRYLRPFLYIFHLGILTVLLFIPSLFLFRKNKEKLTLLIMPILMIFLTFFIYSVLHIRDERPERIYLYIIPYMIIGSIITIKYIIENLSKNYRIFLIIFIIINIAISAFVNTTNSKPWLEKSDFQSMEWIQKNVDNKDIVLAQGYYAQPGRSFGINTLGFYKYNEYTIHGLLLKNDNIYLLDGTQKPNSRILGMQEEIITNDNKYNVYYSNNDQIIGKIIN